MFGKYRSQKKHGLLALFTCFSLILAGCGSDSNDNSDDTATLSGTAATGAAIVGHVEVTGTDGAPLTNVVINDDGSFSADVSNMTPPFILAAIPDDSTQQTEYSYAEAANTIANITSLTTLAMYTATGNQDLANMAANWAAQANQITPAALAAAQAQVNQNFSSQLSAEGLDAATYDFFNAAFNADGTGIDAVMDSVSVDIDMSGGSINVTVGGQPFTFNPNMDISSINIGGNGSSHDSSNDDSSSNDDTGNDSSNDDGSSSDGGLDIDLGDVTGGGDWTLVISGTTTTAGFTVDVPATSVQNLPAPANVSDLENTLNEQYAASGVDGDIAITEISSSSTKVVFEISFSSTVQGFTTTTDLLYTYTKN